MIEIELKARLQDIVGFFSKVSSFARFQRCCYKDDTYWKEPVKEIQIRLREEEVFFTDFSQLHLQQWPMEPIVSDGKKWIPFEKPTENESSPSSARNVVVTYKRKAVLGSSFEVNHEQEFQIDKRGPLEIFLQDTGFSISLKKEKLVAAWEWENVTLELCFIPELGNFLELEVLSSCDGPEVVAAARKKLRAVLALCGVAESAIEGKYYSQLLQEVRNPGNN